MALPKINLDDKQYKEIVQEAIARIPAYTADWTNFNESDPGITLIELFAWSIENQIYKVNKITDKSKLKFLQLLGDEMLPRPPQCAKAELKILTEKDIEIDIPENTVLFAYDSYSKIQIPFIIKKIKTDEGIKNIAFQEVIYTDNYTSNGLPSCCIVLKKTSVDELFSYVDSVTVDGIEAKIVNDFSGSKPDNLHCVFDWGKGSVTFGDGYNGFIPEIGTLVKITYITTLGKRGNVKAEIIKKFVDPKYDKINVKIEFDASGGSNGESITDAIKRVQTDFKVVTRAVTSEDYESLILKEVPGIIRVKALPCFHPKKPDPVPGIVSIIIVPEDKIELKINDFKKAVYSLLDLKYRTITTELFIIEPEYINIQLELNIRIYPQYVFDTVSKKVKECIVKFFDKKSGGLDGKGWPFGRSVYRSEIYRIIDDVERVDFIEIGSINSLNKNVVSDPERNLLIPAHGLIKIEESSIEVINELQKK
jgi:hypothetical protein